MKWETHICVVFTGDFKGECTIERVALVMNIVPCRDLKLEGQALERAIIYSILNEVSDHELWYRQTGNNIGDTGATALSEALKSNTTLTKLILWSEDKRKKTHKTSISNSLSFSLLTDRK